MPRRRDWWTRRTILHWWNINADASVGICHRCEHRQKQCSGPCACTIDGKDIIEHAASIGCPKGYFENPPPQPAPVPLKPVPREEWPLWAKWLRLGSSPEDSGVGDTFKRQLGIMGEVIKATLTAMGAPCGCTERQAEWNALYPLI